MLDGTSVPFFCYDTWNDQVPKQAYTELYSFAKNINITFKEATLLASLSSFSQNFHQLLSIQAYQQHQDLSTLINGWQHHEETDQWTYIWGNTLFSTSKVYQALIGRRRTHPNFGWLWKAKCQMKHKFCFSWLLLKEICSEGN